MVCIKVNLEYENCIYNFVYILYSAYTYHRCSVIGIQHSNVGLYLILAFKHFNQDFFKDPACWPEIIYPPPSYPPRVRDKTSLLLTMPVNALNNIHVMRRDFKFNSIGRE